MAAAVQRRREGASQPSVTFDAWDDVPSETEEEEEEETGAVTPAPGSPRERLRSRTFSLPPAAKDSLTHTYAFGGIHHIFCEHAAAITTVAFAQMDADLLAFASRDGKISLARVRQDPRVVHSLEGHTGAVLDVAWSQSNEYLLSVSEDKTQRLWDTENGECMRIVYNTTVPRRAVFHPRNANEYVTGNDDRTIQVWNLSTGKLNYTQKVPGVPLGMAFDMQGGHLYVGDDQGTLTTFAHNAKNGRLVTNRRSKLALCPGHAITNVAYRGTWAKGRTQPSLLVNCGDGLVRMLDQAPDSERMVQTHQFAIRQRHERIRSCFCPLIPVGRGACITTGSEDGIIYLFDCTADVAKECINKLQGHSSPVMAVDWTFSESVLASGDADGSVLLWKREQTTNTGKIDE